MSELSRNDTAKLKEDEVYLKAYTVNVSLEEVLKKNLRPSKIN